MKSEHMNFPVLPQEFFCIMSVVDKIYRLIFSIMGLGSPFPNEIINCVFPNVENCQDYQPCLSLEAEVLEALGCKNSLRVNLLIKLMVQPQNQTKVTDTIRMKVRTMETFLREHGNFSDKCQSGNQRIVGVCGLEWRGPSLDHTDQAPLYVR